MPFFFIIYYKFAWKMIEIIHKIGYNDDEKFLNQKNEWKCNAKEAFP